MYHFLYNCVFCLAFINFLIYWINLFFSESQAEKYSNSESEHRFVSKKQQCASPAVSHQAAEWGKPQTNNKINNRRTDTELRKSPLSSIKLTAQPFKNLSFTQWFKNFIPLRDPINKLLKKWNINQLNYFRTSFITCSLLWFTLTLLIFLRITQSNHFPLANFYEALIFLTWCLVTLNFIILLEPTEKKSVNLTPAQKNISTVLSFSQITSFYEEPSVQKQVSGAILAPCILFILAFAQFHLSSDVTPLVPALKSNWLLMHVSIMICSYTTFIIGGLLSIILLMQTLFSSNLTSFFRKSSDQSWNNKDKRLFMNYPWLAARPLQKNTIKTEWPSFSQLSYVNNQIRPSNNLLKMQNQMYLNHDFTKPLENLKSNETTNILWQQNLESNWGFPSFEHVSEGSSKMQKKNFYIILDNLSYRMMGIGFPLFTLGILSGAVWANEAWGSYWSWDIKEVGSFINWLLVALYFHCRYKNLVSLSHVVAFISLMVLFFNFFGISLGIFGSSLHAYGASS